MVHDYVLQNTYGTAEMRKVWTEDAMVQKWLDFEKVITFEMASLGMIPSERSPQWLGRRGSAITSGPRPQDILDTGMTLQVRDAYEIIMRQLRELEQVFVEKAEQYRTTVMIGRAHGQHAVPVTFGFLVGTWAYEIRDHIERMKEIAARLFRCKLTAAAGTRNTWVSLFGVVKTDELVSNVAKRLGLGNAPIDIGTRSDHIAEIGFALANISGTLGKIGLDIRFLQSDEVGEVGEPGNAKRQYLPNKLKPEPSEWLDELAKVARQNALALASITALNERDATRTGPQFKCLPENFLLASAGLAQAIRIFSGLVVNADRMRENLYVTDGLLMSELVMLKLWQKTGNKVTAHTLTHDVVMEAIEKKLSLKAALLANATASKYLTPDEIDEYTNPEAYYGDAPEQVDRLVAYINTCRRGEASSGGDSSTEAAKLVIHREGQHRPRETARNARRF